MSLRGKRCARWVSAPEKRSATPCRGGAPLSMGAGERPCLEKDLPGAAVHDIRYSNARERLGEKGFSRGEQGGADLIR